MARGVIMSAMPVATVDRRNVELVRAGTWAASTGRITITRDDLAAAALAAKDPEVDAGPIKIGHTGGLAQLGDSEPALGWVDNLSVGDGSAERPNPDSLYGDLTGIPAGLAPMLEAAYRRRSVELAWNVRTPSGQTHRMVLTGVALLGVAPPAVKGLADVADLYAHPEPKRTAASGDTLDLGADGRLDLLLLAEGVDDPATVASLAAACAGIRGAVDAGATSEASAATMIAALEAAAGVTDPTIRGAATGSGDDDPDDPHKGGRAMPAVDEAKIRELLKLEDDADLEAELEKLVAGAAGDGAGAGTGAGAGDAGGAGDLDADGNPKVPAEVGAALSAATIKQLKDAGLTIVTEGTLATLTAGAAAGTTAAAELATARRDGIIHTALTAGKLTPDEAKTFRARLDEDEAGTVTLLSALAAGRVPVTELGGADGVAALAAGGADDAAWDAWEARTFGLEPSSKE